MALIRPGDHRRGWTFPLTLSLVIAAGTGIAMTFTVVSPLTCLLAVGALAGVVVWFKHPGVVTLMALIAPEEFLSGGSAAPPLLSAGVELYTTRVNGLTPTLAISVAGAVLCTFRSLRRPGEAPAPWRSSVSRVTVWLMSALVVWSLGLSFAEDEDHGPRLLTHGLATGLPFVLLLLAYVIAAQTMANPKERRLLLQCVGAFVVVKAAIAVILLATGTAPTVDTQKNVVFFDAATPLLAAAVLLGYWMTKARGSRTAWMFMTITSLVVIVSSFRRSIWSLVFVGFMIIPLLRQRGFLLVRQATFALLAVAVVLLLPSSLSQTLFGRVGSAVAVAQGSGTEGSAKLHARDITRGFEEVEQHQLLGVGVRSKQIKGFAADASEYLYVHNELLQTWLRFGLPGAALLLLIFLKALRSGIFVLSRERDLDAPTAGAAIVAILAMAPLYTAPFLSTSNRWPVMLGAMFAVVDGARSRLNRPAPDLTDRYVIDLAALELEAKAST